MLQSFLNKPVIYLHEVQKDLFDITGTLVDSLHERAIESSIVWLTKASPALLPGYSIKVMHVCSTL